MHHCRGAVIHVTTVHRRDDARIQGKECDFLADTLTASCSLLVADGLGDDLPEGRGLQITDVGSLPGSRLSRVAIGNWRMFRAIRRLRPTLIHFHDPELMLMGFTLSLLGHKVVYDIHEDVPRQILAKPWLLRLVRRPIASLVAGLEWAAGRLLTGVVAATPPIARRFPAEKTVVVQNFPILSELVPTVARYYGRRPQDFVYVGAIESIRGAREMVRALSRMPDLSGARLQLGGVICPQALEAGLRAEPGWSRVVFHGWAGRAQVANLLGGARAGLVVLHPVGGYPDAYPVKMFEYMACGLPVIASDFPLWRQIIEDASCGLLVDPMDPDAIASAMQWVLAHQEEAEAMGERGRIAVQEKYNWETESVKLLDLYRRLLPKPMNRHSE